MKFSNFFFVFIHLLHRDLHWRSSPSPLMKDLHQWRFLSNLTLLILYNVRIYTAALYVSFQILYCISPLAIYHSFLLLYFLLLLFLLLLWCFSFSLSFLLDFPYVIFPVHTRRESHNDVMMHFDFKPVFEKSAA